MLSGCRQGEISNRIAAGDPQGAYQTARRYLDAFGRERFWIELQQNWVHGDTFRIRHLVRSPAAGPGHRRDQQRPLSRVERHRLQDVLVAIKHRTTLDASHRMRRPNSEFYLKSPAAMAEIFAELPEALKATEIISERCQAFDLTADLGYTFPDFESDDKNETADQHLERVCRKMLAERYGGGPPSLYRRAEERLQQESELVAGMASPAFSSSIVT